MTAGTTLVADLVAVLLCACLAGMVVRRRIAAAPWFAGYLLFTLVTDRLIVTWPDTFYRIWFWNWKEAAAGAFKLAIALDVAVVAFAAWPRPRRLAQGGLSMVALLVLVLSIGMALGTRSPYRALVGLAWCQTGAAWAFVALLVVARRYQLPLHSMHRSIIAGFVLYLVPYSLALVAYRTDSQSALVSVLDPVAYAASVGIWTLAAWTPEHATEPVRRLLYPWIKA